MAISTSSPLRPQNSTNVRAVSDATPIVEERDPALRAWASEVVRALDGPPGLDGTATPSGPRAPAVPWYLRAGFSALGTVAPPLAAAWAEQLFCTAPRYPVPAAEAVALATAHEGSVVVNGQRLATWTWGQGPTVLLVHGWGGRGGQLHGFVPGLLAAGFSVVAFDGPGHGASEGKTSSLVEHGRAVAGVAAALPGRVHAIVAHSMGGAAAGLALEAGLSVEAAVFVAPPFAAGHWLAPFAAALGLPDKVRDGMVRRVEDRLQVRFDDLTMERTAPLMTAPLLVIHDLDDKEVPHAAGAGIVARWPGASLHTTRGLGHKRILGDADVIGRAIAFVRR
jgi:pimeloyl-ACP methyl ester carboxylesterase